MNPNTETAETPFTHHFQFEGRSYRLYKRTAEKDAPWYFRIQREGSRQPRCLETNVAENAVTKAKAMIRAAKGDRWDDFLEKTALRKHALTPLSEIYRLYRAYPNRKPAASTRELNIHAMDQVLGAIENPSVSNLTSDLVWNWKQTILQAAAGTDAEPVSETRHRQLLRSANSRLVQARSLFTPELQSYYKRQGKLNLPRTLDDFLKEPKFPAGETGKTDYWPPSDIIISKTFASLEALLSQPDAAPAIRDQNRNMYVALWLALGFGLRKSEISAARVSWFQEINGIRYCAGDELAKNKRFPRVRCQLGAWDKLLPHLKDLAPDAHVLLGEDSERNDHCFRRIAHWMQSLGWQTQKMVHEFRSYAGCQIAMGDRTGPVDLRAAQEFLRHANITTTENFYMRYLKSQLKEVALQLPTVTEQPFIPKILEA